MRQAEADLARAWASPKSVSASASASRACTAGATEYGGLKQDEAKHLKELEAENARLKRLVAELALDKQMLQEVAQKKW